MFSMVSDVKIEAVDLFCGAGGLTKGLEKAGVTVRLGVDIDPACEYPYSENNSGDFLLQSVSELTADLVAEQYSDGAIKLLAGCAPCQTFSSYNQKATSEDDRWWLLQEFSRLVREVQPEVVTMENVPGLESQDVFGAFKSELESEQLGYKVSAKVIDCSDYGLPQSRKRLVLLASKLGDIKLLSPSQFKRKRKTVRDVISALPPLEAGDIDVKDPLHQAAALSELNLKRIKASKAGGTWRDWEESLRADCHRKSSGKTYPAVYGRMEWDKPAPTMTTQYFGFGNGRFGHPEQDRAISLREGAMLQSFPKGYKFVPPNRPVRKTILGRMIGNAVPVILGELIAKSINAHVKKHTSEAITEI